MTSPYQQLGVSPGAGPSEIKAAYHRKLREYPAHSHPQEFKAIRAAYETLRQSPHQQNDFFAIEPIRIELDATLIAEIEQRAKASIDVSLEDLILLSF